MRQNLLACSKPIQQSRCAELRASQLSLLRMLPSCPHYAPLDPRLKLRVFEAGELVYSTKLTTLFDSTREFTEAARLLCIDTGGDQITLQVRTRAIVALL